jgi:hypothetical protein
MVSISEKTHAKNAENTHIANTIVASIGATFNPNNSLIKANAMTDFESGLNDRMQTVNAAFSAEQNAVGAQIAAFKLVSNRVSKTMKSAKGQGLTPDFIGHLQSTANRLYSVKVNKATPDVMQPDAKSHSTSRRSYAGILESLDLFDEQLKSNPGHAPNEVEYQSATVTAWVQSLRTLHNTALDSKIATRTARNERDSFGYNKTDGLLVRMNALKAYLETILDKNDPRLKQVKKLRFVDYSK